MAVCTQKVKGQIHMKNLIWPSFNTVAQRQHDLCAEGNSRKEVILMFMLFYALFVDLKKMAPYSSPGIIQVSVSTEIPVCFEKTFLVKEWCKQHLLK